MGYTGIDENHKNVFRSEWGAEPEKNLSPIKMPTAATIYEALNLYQGNFRKPSLTVYVMDFSGSMSGTGETQVKEALAPVLQQENARINLLQASENDVNVLIPFSDYIWRSYKSIGNKIQIENLYKEANKLNANGGTDMYKGLNSALDTLKGYELNKYQTAIIQTAEQPPVKTRQ